MRKRLVQNVLLSIPIAVLFGFLSGCNSDETEPTQNDDFQNLALQLNSIFLIAQSAPCDDPDEWSWTDYGSKPCGGPQGYVAYHNSVDTNILFGLIESHRRAEEAYNEKWDISSDCEAVPEPTGVICVGERPQLVKP